MNDGLGILIISPTRELAYQTFEVLKKIGPFHDFSAGLIIGGTVKRIVFILTLRQFFSQDLKGEQERINRTNIIVCTPGRLLQHFDETWNFSCENLKMLSKKNQQISIDETFYRRFNFSYRRSGSNSRLGICRNDPFHRFESSTTETNIVVFCNTNKVQNESICFSTNSTYFSFRSIRELALVSLKKPIYVSVHEKANSSTPSNLTQVRRFPIVEKKISNSQNFISEFHRL